LFLKDNHQDPLFEVWGVNQNIILQNISVVISIILFLCILFAFGIFKYITPLLLFIFVEITQRSYEYILNGGDNFLKFVLFYLVFTDCYRYFSINKPTKEINRKSISYFVNQLSVFSLKIHLCLVYFISAIYKINAKVWFSGVATYYTLQIERFQGTSYNKNLANNGIFSTISTYVTLFWELVFPFLVWFRKTKYVVFATGILIHTGIYILMMIHDFEVLFIMCYGFFISDEEWRKIYAYSKKTLFLLKKKFQKRYA
jgi:hypothetical protein